MNPVIIEHEEKKYSADLSAGYDLSIPLRSGSENPNAFGIGEPLFAPFQAGGFIGSVKQGGSVNCENLFMNPHGNGTHTECVGHISKERITINQTLKSFFCFARLITITPKDNRINANMFDKGALQGVEAIIIRTSPNTSEKLTRIYSGNNPSFFTPECCALFAEQEILHLLTDLPSVDPENDDGKLSAHHAFWKYPAETRMNATITEMIFASDEIPDGFYLLNLHIAPIESDASPSKPVIYQLHVL
jgi:kynurenine formamidase